MRYCHVQLRGPGGSSEHKHLDHSGIWWNDHRRGEEDCYQVTAREDIEPTEVCLEHKGTWYDHWAVAYVDVWHGYQKSAKGARADFKGKWLAHDEHCVTLG